MNRTVRKVRQLGLTKAAEKLAHNKSKFKQYLIKNNWTETDMKQEWFKNKYNDYCFGPQINNLLFNTKGIHILSYGSMYICHFDLYGGMTYPCIYCGADKFEIYE